MCCWVLLILPLLVANVELLPVNNTSYSKVSKWGSVNVNEGRSSGQSLYTQRSEARISSGQNMPKAIHYIMPSNTRVGVDKSNKLPGKGEVIIQDRFNPPPYFEFAPNGDGKPDNSFRPSKPEKPTNLYDSPISSYIPQPSGIPKTKPDISGPSMPPPNIPTGPVYMGKPDAKPGYSYNPPQSQPPIMDDSGSFEGPYAPPADDDPKPDYMDYPPSNSASYDDTSSYEDHKPQQQDHHHHQQPEDHHHPQEPEDHHHHHHHHHQEEPEDHHQEHKHQHDDIPPLSPPPTGLAADFSKHVPEFLDHDPTGSFPYDVPYHFSDHEHDHQVYHEIHHTTTQMPEDTRVNKGHYSYYYLGRKLWYIPLYFSVYFIIYITVLILKSIARHKVNFTHDLHDAVHGRSFDEKGDLEETTNAVTASIDTFKKRYYAM